MVGLLYCAALQERTRDARDSRADVLEQGLHSTSQRNCREGRGSWSRIVRIDGRSRDPARTSPHRTASHVAVLRVVDDAT